MDEHDSYGEIVITDNEESWRFPLMPGASGPGRLSDSNLATFQGKVVFGDYSKDDNPLLSSFVRSDLSGGNGVEALNEGTDLTRFDFGTLYARFAGQITKPLFAGSTDPTLEGAGDKRILGQMWDAPDNRYLVIWMAGFEVKRAVVDGTTAFHSLTTPAVSSQASSGLATRLPNDYQKGVAFRGTGTTERFFIPFGDGYGTITATSTAVTEHAQPDFMSFTLWDNRLVGVDANGKIWTTTTGDNAAAPGDWEALDTTVQIPRSRRVRGIVNFFDRRDEPTLYVITDQDIWQVDPNTPDLFRIDFGFPAHPHHGLASAVWNGQLFISVGMGVMRYTGGSWQPVGLDRDFGLPLPYQGKIVDLVPGYNALYALVQSSDLDSTYGGRSGIYEFNGSGWQCVWADNPAVPTTNIDPLTVTGLILTSAGDVQTLVLSTAGTDDHLYSLPLSLTFANPRAKIGSGQLFGAKTQYYWEDGEFDAGMVGYRKIANAVQWEVDEPLAQIAEERDTLTIQYRIDGGDWETLYTGSATPGRHAVSFGTPTDGVYPGLSFERIKLRVVLDKSPLGGQDRPTILKYVVLTYMKVLSASYAWQGVIDLTGEKGYEGRSNAELRAKLEELVSAERFYKMTYGGVDYRVFFSQTGGDSAGGHDDRGVRRVAILQIPETLTDAA